LLDLDVWQNCSVIGEKFGMQIDGDTPITLKSNLIDVFFIGNGVVGSVGKVNVATDEQGTTTFTNFQG